MQTLPFEKIPNRDIIWSALQHIDCYSQGVSQDSLSSMDQIENVLSFNSDRNADGVRIAILVKTNDDRFIFGYVSCAVPSLDIINSWAAAGSNLLEVTDLVEKNRHLLERGEVIYSI
jgi:hypothetical protein